MKFDVMRSIAHNMADSLGNGCSFLLGVYDSDIFGEAMSTPEGFIVVDILAGTATSGAVSAHLRDTIALCPTALAELCGRHRVAISEFVELTVRYGVDRVYGRHCAVTVKNQNGRTARDQYVGMPARRLRARG